MADDTSKQPDPNSTSAHDSLVDAVYEVALDPGRYDELVTQWHHELTQAKPDQADVGETNSPLADHFDRASTILERVHRDDWEAAQPPATMPEILLSPSGKVLKTNVGATALLSARTGEPLETLDISPAARQRILDLCQTLNSPKKRTSSDDSTLLRITRLGDERPLVVLLSPAVLDARNVLALRCAEIVWPETLGPLLAKAFELTAAECDIVRALLAGQNTQNIAKNRGTSKETVRTQIRQILSKTGTHSQLELTRMTIGFSMMSQQAEARSGTPALAGSPGASTGPLRFQPEEGSMERFSEVPKSRVLRLGSGADIELVQYGADDAPPVLVFHDEVIGDGFVLPLMREAPGYRWLVVPRPGYGATSPPSAGELDFVETPKQVQALNELISTLLPELCAAPLLAHGNGIFFACHFARAYPQRCTSITSLAASLPGDRGQNQQNRYAAFVIGMSRLAPSMLRFAVQAGFAMYVRVGTKRFLEKVYGNTAVDFDVINTPQPLKDLDHGGRLTLAQGYRGFLVDEQAFVDDWSDDFVSTPVPLRIMLGDQDQPDRRYRAVALRERSNLIELVDVENAGFFVAFSAPKIVVQTLFKPVAPQVL